MLQKMKSNMGSIIAAVIALCFVVKLIKDIRHSSNLLAGIVKLAMVFIAAKKSTSVAV